METVNSPQKGEKFRIAQVNKNCFKMYLFGHFIGACSSEHLAHRREKDIADKINRYVHDEIQRRLPEATADLSQRLAAAEAFAKDTDNGRWERMKAAERKEDELRAELKRVREQAVEMIEAAERNCKEKG